MDRIIKNWFSEICPMWPGRALSIEIKKELYSKKSKYQQIDIFETTNCGKMLVLDNIIQLTEDDEFAYQEMLAHVPMFSHPNPRRVLVIGGGDGGILREVAKHKSVEEIDICEIDEEVINVSKKYIPSMACGFDDSRVRVHIQDGNEFIQDRQKYYDVIIVDSSDPIGPGEALFEKPFYVSMKTALKDDGIIATQAESFFLHKEVVKNLVGIVADLFPIYGYSYILIPTYPGGNIGICLGSMKHEVKDPIQSPSKKMQDKLNYYSNEVHKASFILPEFGRRMLNF